MSTNEPSTTPTEVRAARVETSKYGNRMSESKKIAIAAHILANGNISQAAKEFGVHRNTAGILMQSIADVPKHSDDWRSRLTDKLPVNAVDAIECSINDREDVHKAADSGFKLLKGIGALAGDGNASVNVFVNGMSGLPKDLLGDYVTIEAESVPYVQAVDSADIVAT